MLRPLPTQALLDPAAARPDLELWVGKPISQYYAIEMDNLAVRLSADCLGWRFCAYCHRLSRLRLSQMSGYFYAFNALSLYRAFSTYARVTNDTAFITQVGWYLDVLADFYQPYVRDPVTSTLADYSGDPNNYLE